MAYEPGGMSPQERLAISRRALVNRLQGEASSDEAPRSARGRGPVLEGIDWAPMARKMVRHWWQRHPANTASQLALPVLERYAREEPLKLVAGAAAVGALLVLARPWRLLSATAVSAALFKTSDVAGVINTLMQRRSAAPPRKETQ